MKQNCHFHPTKIAHWSCPKCNWAFCPDCIIRRDGGGYRTEESIHLCPKCNMPAEWVGAGNIIEPFWNRLPKFFTYPFNLRPFLLIIVLSIATWFFSGLGLFSMLIHFVAWGILIKYSYEALKTTARGDLTPPKIEAETISNDFHVIFKQFGIFIMIGIAFFWLGSKFGMLFGLLLLIFAILFIPSMIILLVTSNSFLNAINPVNFTILAFRIGRGYLLMYFFLLLLLLAPAALGHYIKGYLPSGLHLLLVCFAKNFYTIISYHLMGYVVLQYHQEIGYQVDYEDFKDPAAIEPGDKNPATEILNRVNPLITEGKLDEAITIIEEMTREDGISDLTLSERYFNLLKMKKRTSGLLKHCVTHLHLLAEENRKTEACEIYKLCLAKDNSFTPTSHALFRLAGWLNESGNSKEAITTYNRLAKAYPEDQLVPKAYFRAAQIFYDRFLDTSRAKRILTGLIKKYPDHKIVLQAKNYLEHMPS